MNHPHRSARSDHDDDDAGSGDRRRRRRAAVTRRRARKARASVPEPEPTSFNPPTSYFAGTDTPALFTRDEEIAVGTVLVAARTRVLDLLAAAPDAVRAAMPPDEHAAGPAGDFREREALVFLETARSVAARTGGHTAFVAELDAALAAYRDSRDRFIEANLRLVLSLARRYRRAGVPYLDLVQEGTLGLIRAIEKFDPVRDVRFGTYAMWWIWQQIGRAGEMHGALIRTPMHWGQLRRKLSRATQRLEARGLAGEREQIAAESGVDASRIDIVRQAFHCLSLAAPVGAADDRPLEEVIASDAPDPETELTTNELTTLLETALDTLLSPREADVIRLRFGTGERQPLTLEEIGQRLGVTRERVRQIEARALRRLGHDPDLRSYLDRQ